MMQVNTLGKVIVAVLAGISIEHGYAHADIPSSNHAYFLNTQKPAILFGRLVDAARSRGGTKNDIMFIRYMYDRNGDGVTDIEFYHRICDGAVSGNPYVTIDHLADRWTVDLNLDGINKEVIKRSEADPLGISAKAPACR